MRLAEFIRQHREPILAEWETFARTCGPAGGTMDIAALRDHANAILTAIAADLETEQTAFEQSEKSIGRMRPASSGMPTAASTHGSGRAGSGFTIEQMVAEFRALRASVIRLWTAAEGGALDASNVEDLTRFSEAIDQALAESLTRYDQEVEHAKETFLAILGHDLRTPLGAIYSSATFMLETGELEEPHRTLTTRIAASAKRTLTMVGDLLDFTRSRLGGGIPITRSDVNIGKIVHEAVDEASAANPESRIEVDTRGEQRGCWDAARLAQVFSNLIGNAVQHGGADTPVVVDVHGDERQVVISVRNQGPVIPPDRLDGLFNPMSSGRAPHAATSEGPTGSLGLGLYIAERIVDAHGGHVEAESSAAGGTIFTVCLPRDEASAGSHD